jgi:amidase
MEETTMAISQGLAMSWAEWAKHDATSLAGLVKKKKLKPKELANQVAAGVELMNGKLAGVLEVFDDVVRNPDAEGPNKKGALYGVPLFLKDLGSGLKGRRQEAGSKLQKGFVAKVTDPTVENFLRAGLVPLGRSTTPEFGMTFDTTTDYLGHVNVTRNPWNLKHTPGGSSGGSAAMVAAGVTPISMASDGGGSTRIPGSFSALVGLKASRGRVPRPIAQNEYAVRISCDGVLTRTVRDTAAAYDYMTRVPNGGSFIMMAPFEGSYVEAIRRRPKKLKIALSTGRWGRSTATDPQVAARVREVAKLLEGLGHDIDDIDDKKICDWAEMWESYSIQWVGSRSQFLTMAKDKGIDPRELKNLLGPMNYRHYLGGDRYDKFDVWKMMAKNNAVTRRFGKLMDEFDLLLTPTLAVRVPEANGPYSLLRDEDLDAWVNRLEDACRYTMPGNETGLPGISVPSGWDRDGLPIGTMLYGNFAREDLLLQVAAQIERAKPEWFNRSPPVHVTTA